MHLRSFIGDALFSKQQPLSDRINVVSFSLFICYFHCRFSDVPYSFFPILQTFCIYDPPYHILIISSSPSSSIGKVEVPHRQLLPPNCYFVEQIQSGCSPQLLRLNLINIRTYIIYRISTNNIHVLHPLYDPI